MGGLDQVRNDQELLWGYNDPLLTELGEQKPGSVPWIEYSGGNQTLEEGKNATAVMNTGYSNQEYVRQYEEYFGHSTIVANRTTFNGNTSYVEYYNPWKEEIPLSGTDGALNAPDVTPDSQRGIFLNMLSWKGNLTYTGENKNYNGLDTLRFSFPESIFANKTNNPANDKYRIEKWNGLLNVTTVYGVPMFMSFAHFYQADEEIQNAVNIYNDSTLKHKIEPSKEQDQTTFDLEPTTGVTINFKLKL